MRVQLKAADGRELAVLTNATPVPEGVNPADAAMQIVGFFRASPLAEYLWIDGGKRAIRWSAIAEIVILPDEDPSVPLKLEE